MCGRVTQARQKGDHGAWLTTHFSIALKSKTRHLFNRVKTIYLLLIFVLHEKVHYYHISIWI